MSDEDKISRQFILEQAQSRRLKSHPVLRSANQRSTDSSSFDGLRRLAELAEMLPQIVYEIDLEGRIVFVNRSGMDALGYTVDDLAAGFAAVDAFVTEDRDKVTADIENIFRGGPLKPGEYTIQRKDGSTFPVLSYSAPIMKNHEIVGIRGVCVDISGLKRTQGGLEQAVDRLETRIRQRSYELRSSSERLQREMNLRKQTENALSWSEQKFWIVVDNAREGIFVVQNERFQFVNPRVLEILGYEMEDLLSKPFIEFIHSDDADMVLQRYRRRISGQNPPSRYPLRMIHRTGALKWVEIHVNRVNWEGRPGVMGFLTDTSERVRTQEALRKSEEKCQTIIENIEDGYYEVDLPGNLTFFNDALCKILGYPAEELMGLNFRGYADKPNSERCFRIFNKVYKTGVPTKEHNWEIIRRDGERRIIEVSISLIISERGEPEGFRGTVRDITERKRIEHELQRHRYHLQDVIEERTQELRRANQRLLTAQENERKRVAQELHDGIGQCLTGIKFGLENAIRQAEREKSATSMDSLEALIPVIRGAMEEVRRISMDLRPYMLDDLGILATIKWCSREFEKLCPQIRIVPDIRVKEDDIPELLKVVIFRVLQEALSNIGRHAKADLVSLMLSMNDGILQFFVKDNGIGFDPTELQSGHEDKRGFGLSSMKERVQLSGGTFSAEAEAGKGTAIAARWTLSEVRVTEK